MSRHRAPARVLAVVAVLTATTACTGSSREGGTNAQPPERREVVLDHGTGDVVDLRPVSVQAAPGDVVVLRSANPGRGSGDESPVHHLFTSAPSDAPPPLFAPAGPGLLPNPGVWGMCRGGAATDATTGCPVPPIEGPTHYDGHSYFSLGALLPTEQRELPLAEDLEPGTYRFTCAVHPRLRVDVEVVEDPAAATRLPALDAGQAAAHAEHLAASHGRHVAAGKAVVLLAPQPKDPPAEVLHAVPAEVRVPVGGTVVWRNPSRAPHTVELGIPEPPHLADTTAAETIPVVPADGLWDGEGQVRSGILSADPSVDRTELRLTFTRPGLYRAYDRFAPSITTTVHVG